MFGTKPLPESMQTYCQLNPRENFSEISINKFKFSFQKMYFKLLC